METMNLYRERISNQNYDNSINMPEIYIEINLIFIS